VYWRKIGEMTPVRIAAVLVHVLTALGAVCAFFATLAIFEGDWEKVFYWLGAAFIIDGVDGPFARFVRVKDRMPRFSGEQLDLVIDYLTYVFVPTLALWRAGIVSGWAGEVVAVGILVSSLFHFSDLKSKGEDLSFVGFPALWNFVAFYLFTFQLPALWVAVVTGSFVILTFVPLKWVHPIRVRALRGATVFMSVVWFAAAFAVLGAGFGAAPPLAKFVLLGVGAYGLAVTVYLSLPKNIANRC
jgi:phosphatidylcholine synthase